MHLKFTVELINYEPEAKSITREEVTDALMSLLNARDDNGTVAVSLITAKPTPKRRLSQMTDDRLESPGRRHREITDGGSL